VCITFYFTVTGVIVSLLGLVFQGWIPPPPGDLALLMLVGLLGGLAQYLMTLSYQRLPIATVSPLKYVTIVFSGIIGYLVWGDIPDLQSMCGIALIITTGLYTLHRELTVKSRITV
jgi:drug/metabolite transporter (DMT)-like permease